MSKELFLTFISCTVSLAVGCGGESPANSTANAKANTNTNAVTPVRLDPANMPPGLSATPITPAPNAADANKPMTPTPGIPSPAEMKKAAKQGTTPTPGIPSPEEMRKAFGKPPSSSNTNTAPMSNSVPMMMKTNRKLGGRP